MAYVLLSLKVLQTKQAYTISNHSSKLNGKNWLPIKKKSVQIRRGQTVVFKKSKQTGERASEKGARPY
ncbi:hypothetical protein DB29_02784 [Shouchella clausii]|nr:hypothetical protein DB29_02784 [Shouchella clausii]